MQKKGNKKKKLQANRKLLFSAVFAFVALLLLLLVIFEIKSMENIGIQENYQVSPLRTVAELEATGKTLKETPKPEVKLNKSLLKTYTFTLLTEGDTSYLLSWQAFPTDTQTLDPAYSNYNFDVLVDLVKIEDNKKTIIRKGFTQLTSFFPRGYFSIADHPSNSYIVNLMQGAEGSDGLNDYLINVKTGTTFSTVDLYNNNVGYEIPYNSKSQTLKFFAVSILEPFTDPQIALYSYNLVTAQKQTLWILNKGEQFECGGDYKSVFTYKYTTNKIEVSSCDSKGKIIETRGFDYY